MRVNPQTTNQGLQNPRFSFDPDTYGLPNLKEANPVHPMGVPRLQEFHVSGLRGHAGALTCNPEEKIPLEPMVLPRNCHFGRV